MEKNMTSLSLSRWLTLGALVLTMVGGFSRSAYAQNSIGPSTDQKADPAAGQKLLAAKGASAPFALESTLTNTTAITAAPAPPPPSSGFTWTGFYVGVNIGRGSAGATTRGKSLPRPPLFVQLPPT